MSGKKDTGCCRSFFTRLVFILHGGLSVYMLYINKNLFNDSAHFVVLVPLSFLLLESVFTLCFRKGKEFAYVWPCGFFYVLTIVPIVWLLELRVLEQRHQGIENNTTLLLEVAKFIGSNDTAILRKLLIPDALKVSDESGKQFCEIGVLIGLIIGRWMSPRGWLSRNQISAMLLGYVATAADILGFLDSIKDSEMGEHTSWRIVIILTVYTWSMMQFAFVTALPEKNTAERPEPRIERYVVDVEAPQRIVIGTQAIVHEVEHDKSCGCHSDLPEMFVGLFMQDGPFLVMRIYLCEQSRYEESHIFFICKNAFICFLYLYRLGVLFCEREGDQSVKTHEKAKEKKKLVGK